MGISQETLAIELRVGVVAVQRLERSNRIGKQILYKLIHLFNLKIGDSVVTLEDIKEFSEIDFVKKIKGKSKLKESLTIEDMAYRDLLLKMLKSTPQGAGRA